MGLNPWWLVGVLAFGFAGGWSFADSYHERKADKLNEKIAALESANSEYKTSTERQNEAIQSLNEYANQRANEYAELLKRPEVIRYKEVKSDECKDVFNILDDIRINGL